MEIPRNGRQRDADAVLVDERDKEGESETREYEDDLPLWQGVVLVIKRPFGRPLAACHGASSRLVSAVYLLAWVDFRSRSASTPGALASAYLLRYETVRALLTTCGSDSDTRLFFGVLQGVQKIRRQPVVF